MTSAVAARYTPDDLLRMPDGKMYELVDGTLVEKPIGFESSVVGGVVYRMIGSHVRKARLGLAVPEASYQCFRDDPSRVRKPDASYIRRERLPAGGLPKGHCPIVPDLAVEVISPNDEYYEVEAKVDEYLAAGVKLVWVVEPPGKSVRVHRADGTVADFGPDTEITGEDIIPGFRCKVAEFFADPLAEPQS